MVNRLKRCLVFKEEPKRIELLSFLFDELYGKEDPNQEFIPININLILTLSRNPCHFYIKITEKRFLKLFIEDDEINVSKLKGYQEKDVAYLYVLKDDFYSKCNDLFRGSLISKNMHTENEDFVQKANQVIHSFLIDFGISQSLIKEVHQVIDESLKELSKDNEINDLLLKFKGNESMFLYGHSYLTSVFCTMVAEKKGWKTMKTLQAFAVASMLHDLGFSSGDTAKYETNTLKEIENCPKTLREEILNHGPRLAEQLSNKTKISEDVLKIIAHHHEGKGEESYPRNISSLHISQMECIFNMSHEFSVGLYAIAFNPRKIRPLIDKVVDRYSTGNYKAIINAFKDAFSDFQ
ncbi:MAG: HD domain-containing protein [Halobacteriovoraceae bacterium]|jgi:HD-GYP domain-containing protein (c-di-GMP phosphodiesterase class II)|nr:HD domain-containing protein [Halobacteriovoraceae bacterium]